MPKAEVERDLLHQQPIPPGHQPPARLGEPPQPQVAVHAHAEDRVEALVHEARAHADRGADLIAEDGPALRRLEIRHRGGGDAGGTPVGPHPPRRRRKGAVELRAQAIDHVLRHRRAGRPGRDAGGDVVQAQQPGRARQQARQMHRAPVARRGQAVEDVAKAGVVEHRHRPALPVLDPGMELGPRPVQHRIGLARQHAVEPARLLRPAGREEQRPGARRHPRLPEVAALEDIRLRLQRPEIDQPQPVAEPPRRELHHLRLEIALRRGQGLDAVQLGRPGGGGDALQAADLLGA